MEREKILSGIYPLLSLSSYSPSLCISPLLLFPHLSSFMSSAGKPRIDRTNFKSVTIKVGRSHKWAVDYIGEPDPEVEWIFKENVLSNSERIRIENTDHHTEFSVTDAKRKDAGLYTLKIENRNGKDSETVELVVLGEWICQAGWNTTIIGWNITILRNSVFVDDECCGVAVQ